MTRTRMRDFKGISEHKFNKGNKEGGMKLNKTVQLNIRTFSTLHVSFLIISQIFRKSEANKKYWNICTLKAQPALSNFLC